MMSWKPFRSICMPIVSRHWTSGRPAAIIVVNDRVQAETSLPRTVPIKPLRTGIDHKEQQPVTARFAAVFWTTIPWERSWRAAARSSGAVISARTCPPPAVTPRYVKFGMASPVPDLAGGRGHRLVHHAEQLVRIRASGQRLRPRDRAAEVQVRERLVHRLHPKLLAGLHRRVYLVDLFLADHVADGRCGHQDLHGQRPSAAVTLRDQELIEDGFED